LVDEAARLRLEAAAEGLAMADDKGAAFGKAYFESQAME